MIARRKRNQVGSAWLQALNWEESAEALIRLPVLMPVGGGVVEHGRHLPYDTDRVIAEALVEAVAERTPVLVAPTIDYVYAPEVAGNGGTISLSPDAFIGLVSDVIRSLARHGAQEFVIVDRGTGTHAPLNIVSRELHGELGVNIAVANSAGLAHSARTEVIRAHEGEHAGEMETSLMLALAPDRVALGDAVVPEPNDLPQLSRSGPHEPVVFIPERLTGSGVAGDPSAATADKGHHIFDAIVDEIVQHIESEYPASPPPASETSAEQAHALNPDASEPATWSGVLVGELRGDEWRDALANHSTVVLPLGAASKEHGYHLPNQTDYLTAEALKDAVLEHAPVLVLPTFGFGYYPAFVDWPGSMSLSPSTYRAVIRDILGCLAEAGVRKVLLLDTGLSTRPVLEIAAREATREFGILVALATTEIGREAAQRLFDGEGTHANEDETTLMLAIAPEQVDMSRATPDLRPSTVIDRRDPFAPPAFVQGGKMRSASGVFGDPTKATAENGRTYFDAKVADLLAFLEEFIK